MKSIANKCKLEDCKGVGTLTLKRERKFFRGLCANHYNQDIKQRRLNGEPSKNYRRPATIEGDIAKIPLGINAKDGYAIIDKEFAHLADVYNYCINPRYGYALTTVNNKVLHLHHQIVGKPPTGLVTDHINRNPLDNRKANLRFVTQKENVWNSREQNDNKSGFKHVSWANRDKVWRVEITRNGKKVFSGRFRCLKEAIDARDQRVNYLGECYYERNDS